MNTAVYTSVCEKVPHQPRAMQQFGEKSHSTQLYVRVGFPTRPVVGSQLLEEKTSMKGYAGRFKLVNMRMCMTLDIFKKKCDYSHSIANTSSIKTELAQYCFIDPDKHTAHKRKSDDPGLLTWKYCNSI